MKYTNLYTNFLSNKLFFLIIKIKNNNLNNYLCVTICCCFTATATASAAVATFVTVYMNASYSMIYFTSSL